MQSNITTEIQNAIYRGIAIMLFLVAPLAMASDWPQWRGPNRNGVSPETITWPAAGPKQLWKAAVGQGYSCVSVCNGRVYTMGNVKADGSEMTQDGVWCLDARTGTVIWKYIYPYPEKTIWKRYDYPGTLMTPTVDGNLVYTVNRNGFLLALDAAKGTVVWSANFVKDFAAKEPHWGFVGSPLIDGNLLLVNAGGKGASAVAFDKTTGKVVWKSGDDPASYSSPVTFAIGAQRMVAMFSANGLYTYNLADGKELWNVKWFTSYYVNAVDPIPLGDKIFITSGYGTGCSLLKMTNTNVKEVYRNKKFSSQTANLVMIGSFLYGFSGRQQDDQKLTCLDPNTGDIKWKNDKVGGELIAAGNKLIIQSLTGKLIVAEASPDGYKELGSAPALTGQCWTAPSLANGCVFCRNTAGDVVCLDLTGK